MSDLHNLCCLGPRLCQLRRFFEFIFVKLDCGVFQLCFFFLLNFTAAIFPFSQAYLTSDRVRSFMLFTEAKLTILIASSTVIASRSLYAPQSIVNSLVIIARLTWSVYFLKPALSFAMRRVR